jgi:tRNA C32,U32 (ribose-2'-O)-methylase TrmJ
MLTAAQRARLTIVLVGARNPQNIGAAARALHDFGFSDLRVVNSFAAPFEAAQLEAAQTDPAPLNLTSLDPSTQQIKSAVSARRIMLNARRFDTLPEAIADCALIAGTTAIGDRELRQTVLPLQQAAPQILNALQAEIANPSPAASPHTPAAPKTALLLRL